MLDDFNCNINSLLVLKCPQRITELVGMIVYVYARVRT